MPDAPIDIPFKAPTVEATAQDTHARVELTPNGNAALAFELLVPKHWAYSREFGPVTEMLFQPQGLGFFVQAVEVGAPIIGVTVTRCPFEVALDIYARESVIREGWTIVACNWFPGPQGMFYDLTAYRKVGEIELIRRTSLRIDQARIFTVNTLCTRQHWDAVKESFWAAHVTFALAKPTNDETCEQWLIASATSPDFKVAYPLSWTAEPAQSQSVDQSGIHVRLLDPKGQTLLAYVFVQAERVQSGEPPALAQRVRNTLDLITRSGVQLTSDLRPVPEPEDLRAGAVEGWLAGYRAEGQLGSAEIQIRTGFVQHGPLMFTIVVCTPQLEDDTLVHLRAVRTFEIVRGSLR